MPTKPELAAKVKELGQQVDCTTKERDDLRDLALKLTKENEALGAAVEQLKAAVNQANTTVQNLSGQVILADNAKQKAEAKIEEIRDEKIMLLTDLATVDAARIGALQAMSIFQHGRYAPDLEIPLSTDFEGEAEEDLLFDRMDEVEGDEVGLGD